MNNRNINFENLVKPEVKGGFKDYVLKDKNGKIFFPTEEQLKRYIAKISCLIYHFELKGSNNQYELMKKTFKLYSYTEEFVLLLIEMLDKYEKEHLIFFYNRRYEDLGDLLGKVYNFCSRTFVDEISTIRNSEHGQYVIHRLTEDMFSNIKNNKVSDFYKGSKNINELILTEISKNTNNLKNINKEDFLLLYRILKYKYNPKYFSYGLGVAFALDFKTHISHYYSNYEKYKILLGNIIENKIRVVIKKNNKNNKNNRGRKI